MNVKIFASNISALRLMKGWTQEDLAIFLNVTRQAVSKWETGVSTPDLDVLLYLSKLFSITINDLIEKPVNYGISEFEEILKIDADVIKIELSKYAVSDLIIAAKGSSQGVCHFLSSIFPEIDFPAQMNHMGPVRVSEVEKIQKKMVESVNLSLID
mgnify:CR=1 FL=1